MPVGEIDEAEVVAQATLMQSLLQRAREKTADEAAEEADAAEAEEPVEAEEAAEAAEAAGAAREKTLLVMVIVKWQSRRAQRKCR